MSLDVYLELPGVSPTHAGTGIFVREGGSTRELTRAEWDEKFPGREPVVAQAVEDDECVFRANITHNLNDMANAAGIYEALWRPEEIDIERAEQMILPLAFGLERLLAEPDKFKAYSPKNGWGSYDSLVRFVSKYLAACRQYPQARVRASR